MRDQCPTGPVCFHCHQPGHWRDICPARGIAPRGGRGGRLGTDRGHIGQRGRGQGGRGARAYAIGVTEDPDGYVEYVEDVDVDFGTEPVAGDPQPAAQA